jgi:hypothetical protein
LAHALLVGLCVLPPKRLRSREEQEVWDSLLVRRSEFERAKIAYDLLSGSDMQERARAEFTESRRRYLVALQAFSAYVYSTLPFQGA